MVLIVGCRLSLKFDALVVLLLAISYSYRVICQQNVPSTNNRPVSAETMKNRVLTRTKYFCHVIEGALSSSSWLASTRISMTSKKETVAWYLSADADADAADDECSS